MMLGGLLVVPLALLMTDFSQPINYSHDGVGLAAVIQSLNAIGALTARARIPPWQGDHRLAAGECRRAAAHRSDLTRPHGRGARTAQARGIALALAAALLLALQSEEPAVQA